jgi:uncharacterized protein (TIGR03437 family)
MRQSAKVCYAARLAMLIPVTASWMAIAEEPVVLEIETRDAVLYRGDTFAPSTLGTNASVTTSSNLVFLQSVNAGDIVAVNGKPAKGLWQYHVVAMPFRVNPAPRQPIADVDSSGLFHCHFHVLQADGTYVGELIDAGVNARPGMPHAINGGLGAFFGATGEVRMTVQVPQRGASTSEDPANRRNHGGGTTRHTVILYPKHRPEIEMTQVGAAVFHSDFSPVSAGRPARVGETLILRARGLGPVRPDLQVPGFTRFTSDPLQEVNSPVNVTFNGEDALVVNKIGWPGERDVYRVDFVVPQGTAIGAATVRLVVAWIPSAEVVIPML